MKKTIIVLLVGISLITSGCTPFVLSITDTVSIVGDEPVHVRFPLKQCPNLIMKTVNPAKKLALKKFLN